MKKVTVIAIAVLLSLVGVGYAKEQANLAGQLSSLSLSLTYEQDLPGTKTLSEGRKLVKITPGIDKVATYEPVLYFFFDPTTGNLTNIYISWISPSQGSSFPRRRIWTMSCQPGVISQKPQLSSTKPPATKSNSVEGNATCIICPNGIEFANTNYTTGSLYPGDPSTAPTGNCAAISGDYSQPEGLGYLTFTGIDYKSYDSTSQNYYTTSVSVTGAVGGSAFDYIGGDWASADGTPEPVDSWSTFPALFTGTFGSMMRPCSATDPYCLTIK